MTLIDWRLLPAARVAPLLAAESRWWHDTLGWDLATSWVAVEPARAAGRLPGFVLGAERARPLGWAFFLRHGDAVQVGALSTESATAVTTLLDGIEQSPEVSAVPRAIGFVPARSPGVADAFRTLGYAVEPYAYLEAPVEWSEARLGVRGWDPADRVGAATLLGRAYRPTRIVRPFVPDGSREGWREDVDQLLDSPACGTFLPHASATVCAASGALQGLVLTTAISPQVAHIAQVAVDPAAQRRGIGEQLVRAAVSAAAGHGYRRITLLVAASNDHARQVYERVGFRETARFIAAVRNQPRPSTSAAPVAGGASTLR